MTEWHRISSTYDGDELYALMTDWPSPEAEALARELLAKGFRQIGHPEARDEDLILTVTPHSGNPESFN